jgi:siroheme synthase
VAFVTGHRAGQEALNVNWQALAQGVDTLVFLMGVHNLAAIVTALTDAGRPCETPAAIIEQGTLPGQKVVTGTLANILDVAAEIRPPAILIVGEVVNLHTSLEWFDSQLQLLAE